MKKLFGTKLLCALLFLSIFVFCREKPSPKDTSLNTALTDKEPYIWEKSQGGWAISLKPDYAPPDAMPWSLFLYYSWTGADEENPVELRIERNVFDFFPKANSAALKTNNAALPEYKNTFLVFHQEQWKSPPRKITIGVNKKESDDFDPDNFKIEDFRIIDVKLESRSINSSPLIADPGTMLYYPPSSFRNRNYEFFCHNLYPSLLYLVSGSFNIQSQFLKRLAFFTEKVGFTGRLAKDEEIAGLRDWFAHDYRSKDLAAFYDLAQKQNFPLNDSELVLRELLLEQGIIRTEGGSFIEGEGALLGFSVESKDRLPVYYVHETVHGLEFILPELDALFLDFFNALSSSERVFIRDALLYRGYNVIKDRQLLTSEAAAYLLQQRPEETDKYFREYVMPWYTEYHKDPEVDYSEEPYSDAITEFFEANPGIFGRRSAVLQEKFYALTGLRAEIFYDLLPKDRRL